MAEIETQLSIPPDVARLAEVRAAVAACAAEAGFDPRAAQLAALAADEHLANVICHGFHEARRAPQPIRIRVAASAARLEVSVRDCGAGFDPRGGSGLDLARHIAAGRRSGLGLWLIQRLMDELDYRPAGARSASATGVDENQLVMVKYNRVQAAATV